MVGREPDIVTVFPATEGEKEEQALFKEHSSSSHMTFQTPSHGPPLAMWGAWTMKCLF